MAVLDQGVLSSVEQCGNTIVGLEDFTVKLTCGPRL